LHPPAQSLPRLYDREVQVPFRSFGLRLDGIELQSLQLHRFHGRILEGEKYLDQRVLAQAALRAKFFDQLLKRHVLVRVRAQRRFFHSIDQLAKTWISMNPCCSASVLAKKPINPSNSRRTRFAIGAPTTISS